MDFSYSDLKLAPNRDNVILDTCRNKRVLHIGAADSPYTKDAYATGLLLHKRLSEVASELIGIDLDAAAADWLNQKGLPKVYVTDLNEAATLNFAPDVIVFGETIEHVPDPGHCLDVLKSCMGAKTKLIITTPNCFDLRFFSMVLHNHERIHDDHKVGFTYGLLAQLLSSKQLKIDDFYFTFLPRKHYPIWMRLRHLIAKFRHGFGETLLATCSLSKES